MKKLILFLSLFLMLFSVLLAEITKENIKINNLLLDHDPEEEHWRIMSANEFVGSLEEAIRVRYPTIIADKVIIESEKAEIIEFAEMQKLFKYMIMGSMLSGGIKGPLTLDYFSTVSMENMTHVDNQEKPFYPSAFTWSIILSDSELEELMAADKIIAKRMNRILPLGDNREIKLTFLYFSQELDEKQCNNFMDLIIEIDSRILMVSELLAENKNLLAQLEDCSSDTITVKVPVIQYLRKKPWISLDTWLSFSTDQWAGTSKDSINYGHSYINNIHNSKDGHFIWTLNSGFTLKFHLDNLAAVMNLEGSYNDGPIEWKAHIFGLEKDWYNKFYLQIGPELRYREWSFWGKKILAQLEPDVYQVAFYEEFIPIYDLGPYLEINWFNSAGDNHFKLYTAQGFRQPKKKVQLATTDLKTSLKLELKKLYLYHEFRYTNIPITSVDSLNIPLLDRKIFEPRLGYAVHRDWILFARYRNIQIRTWEDEFNPEWYRYQREDWGGGLLYQPRRFLGLKNFQIEFISSHSHIEERFKNPFRNTEDDVVEFKVTFSYRWKNQ